MTRTLREQLSDFTFQADPRGLLKPQVLAIFGAEDADQALEKARAGERVEIEIVAHTFIQRDEPNRNFLRFKNGILPKLARSGVDTPFLRNHDQSDVMARGGTVTKSKLVKQPSGERVFEQVIRLTKPWAVEGVLDGTLDRFSIGWLPTGPIVFSHSGEEVKGWPEFWPGDELDDGTIVEWVFTDAELIETSGVNVPAVTGTGIESVRTALSAVNNQRGKEPPKETPRMDGSLLSTLGLREGASEDEILRAVEELKNKNKEQATELSATRTTLERTQKELADADTERENARAEKLDAEIERLYREEKLVRLQHATGAQPDPLEENLRELAKIGMDKFHALANNLRSQRAGAGKPPQSETPEPKDGGNVLLLDKARRRRMAALGLTEQSYEFAPGAPATEGKFWLGQIPAKKQERKA